METTLYTHTNTHTHLYAHLVEYYLAIKEWNFAICNKMDGSGEYYAKWSKSDRERQILCVFTYM